MKKRIWLVLAAVLAMVVVMTACGNGGGGGAEPPAPAPDPAPAATEPAPAPAPADDETFAATPDVTLILTNHDPDGSLPGQYCFAWADQVYDMSKGRIKVEVNNGGSLAGPVESLDKVRDGSVDLAFGLQSFYPGQFPLSDGLSLPYLPYASAAQASEIIMDIYESGVLDSEYKGVKVILLRSNCDAPIITAKKKLDTVDDLKGMTLRATAAPLVSWLAEFGAGGQGCPIGELYQNLLQGTFDGALTDWHAVNSFSLYEAAQYYADEAVQYNTYYFLMNENKYNSLDPELQAVIDACSGQAALAYMKGDWDDMTKTAKQTATESGNDVYKMADAEHQKLVDAADKVQQQWIADNGDAGKQIFDRIVELAG